MIAEELRNSLRKAHYAERNVILDDSNRKVRRLFCFIVGAFALGIALLVASARLG